MRILMWLKIREFICWIVLKIILSDALLRELPLVRLEDHGIEIILAYEPPNKPPYRVSAMQLWPNCRTYCP